MSDVAQTGPGPRRADTTAVHAGRDDLVDLGVHAPPLQRSTTFPLPSVDAGGEAYDHMGGGERRRPDQTCVYQRLWSPNVARFEEGVAALEGSDDAVAFATGMAAMTGCLLAAVAEGRPHVVGVRPLYGGTDTILDSGLLGTQVTWTTADGVADAVTPSTGLVVFESPANPSLELVSIDRIVDQAGDVPVLIDNTFATPILQQPHRHGVQLSLHSATKYMGGHGDLMGGVVAVTGEWAQRLRPVRALTGGILAPDTAYGLHRGLQTIGVRVRAAQQGAEAVARWLADHPAVERVAYPGLPGCDPQGLVGTQMTGPGSMLAMWVKGGFDAAARVAQSCRLITHAVSLGGVDTLVEHPAALTHRMVADDARPHAGLLRLAVGLEDADDLVDDLAQALS